MNPIEILMQEHRLIERMVGLLEEELSKIKEKKLVDANFIDFAVDFMNIYTDKSHHGKEEDVLFRDLGRKALSQEDKRIMDELIEEHNYFRRTVVSLVNAKEKYVEGEKEALSGVMVNINELIKLYPAHIDKEDNNFFISTQAYLSKREWDNMFKEFQEFDRNVKDEKYKTVVKKLEWENKLK
jgi:hemerythrin-like domain-containing protein